MGPRPLWVLRLPVQFPAGVRVTVEGLALHPERNILTVSTAALLLSELVQYSKAFRAVGRILSLYINNIRTIHIITKNQHYQY